MGVEHNVTVTAQVASKLDKSLDSFSQDMLISLFNKFPQLGHSFLGVTYAQIILAVALFVLLLFIRPLAVTGLIKLLLKLSSKSKTSYDDKIVKALHKPLKFAFLIFGLYIFVSILYIQNEEVYKVLDSLVIINFFWILAAIVHALQGIVYKAMHKLTQELSDSLARFVLKLINILIWVLAGSSVLSLWGINVTALLASLGLGGLAFALAAKDTAANLFGSIAILIDKSIKIGDWIRVDGIDGFVEDIGMRTTKIRTFEKSLIIVPNQIIANSKIENMSRRNSRRISLRIGLTYDTDNEQIEKITKEIKQMLNSHSGIDQNDLTLVSFDNFGDSAKEIFIYTHSNTSIWKEYLAIKESINYKINEIVEKNGSSFAFPSQSIYVEQLPGARGEG